MPRRATCGDRGQKASKTSPHLVLCAMSGYTLHAGVSRQPPAHVKQICASFSNRACKNWIRAPVCGHMCLSWRHARNQQTASADSANACMSGQQPSARLHKPLNPSLQDLHTFLGILHCLRTFTHFPGYLTMSNRSLKESNPSFFSIEEPVRHCKIPRKMCKSAQIM